MSITRHQAVGAYRRWEPPSFNEDGEAPAEPVESAAPEPAPEPEPALPPDFQFPTAEELERMQDEARAEARREGYDAGFAEGRAAGYAEGGAQARAEAERLAALAGQLEDAFAGLDAQVTEELMGLALALTRKMVRGTLAERPEAIVDTIRAALHELPHGNARIRLHPDDAALVRDHLGEQLGHGEHRLLEDESITRGGCLLEAGGTQVDASVETRWRRVIESLGRSETAWEPEQ